MHTNKSKHAIGRYVFRQDSKIWQHYFSWAANTANDTTSCIFHVSFTLVAAGHDLLTVIALKPLTHSLQWSLSVINWNHLTQPLKD